MNKGATLKFIMERQRRWAEARHVAVNSSGRVSRLEDNLFAPLHTETRLEIEHGDGDEFGTPDKVGKIYSVHSSSALACNLFDYWRKRPMSQLLGACNIGSAAGELKFEQKFSTGVGSEANLDVLITGSGSDCFPVAIESKFTEPFQTGERDCLRAAYFSKPEIWEELGNCRGLADSLTATDRFKCLKAGQLLKHALALTRKFGAKRFVLLYLWYDVRGSEAAKRHRDEVEQFGKVVCGDVLFRSDTYQSVFQRLTSPASASDYETYLRTRYFE